MSAGAPVSVMTSDDPSVPAATGTATVPVIQPSRNEAPSLPIVLAGLASAPGGRLREILVADERDDDRTVAMLAAEHPRLRWRHRDQGRGLARAVVEGLAAATGSSLVVLDADGQHPPDAVPRLVEALERADVAVGSRHAAGGSPAGLAGWRRVALSRLSRTLAHSCCARLRATTDPMSGFFAVRTGALDGAVLAPRGWKLLVEILMAAPSATVVDVPFMSAAPVGGQSRFHLGAPVDSAHHLLARARTAPPDRARCIRTAGVGLGLGLGLGTGVFVLGRRHQAARPNRRERDG